MVENLEEFENVRAKAAETAVKEGVAHSVSSKANKGKFLLNFPRVISQFEDAMQKFPVKKILYKQILRGKGLEFDAYRVYESSDDASMIDWKASLRANQTLTRKYIEERKLNVYFLLDVSSSMLFGSSDKLKAEYAAEFVASVSHLIVGSGDNIGMVMFNDDVVKILRPSASKNQFALFTRFLSDSSLYGGNFDLSKAIDYVLRTVKSEYTVFILVSDFIGTKKSDLRSLRLMGSKFETFSVVLRDQLDDNLPKTNYQLSIQDPYSGRQMILDPKIASKKYRENVIRQRGLLTEMFEKSRIDFLNLTTDKDFTIPFSSFLKGRAKGARI